MRVAVIAYARAQKLSHLALNALVIFERVLVNIYFPADTAAVLTFVGNAGKFLIIIGIYCHYLILTDALAF